MADCPVSISKLPVLVLHFLLDVNQIGGANISFQILRQGFCRLFQIPLIVLQSLKWLFERVSNTVCVKLLNYLKDFTLVVFPQIVGKDVSVHQSPPTLAQDVHGLFQKLHFDPRHVVLLHLIHLLLHHGVQLVLEL